MTDLWRHFTEENEALAVLALEEVAGGPGQPFVSGELVEIGDLLRSLCGSLRQYLALERGPRPPRELDPPLPDHPIWGPILQAARSHRDRGGDVSLFLGLLKDLRRAFLRHLIALGQRENPAAVLDLFPVLDGFFNQADMIVVRDRLLGDLGDLLSEIRDSNRSLARQNGRWRALFESFPAPLMVLDEESRLRLMNDTARRLVLQAGEWTAGLIGQPLAEVLPRLDFALKGSAADGDGWATGTCLLPSARGDRGFRVRSRVLRSLRDEVLGRLVYLEEIRDEEPLLEQAKRRCQTLEMALETASVGLLLVDRDGRITFLNHPAEEVLGAGDWIGREAFQVLSGVEVAGSDVGDAVRDRRGGTFEVHCPSRGGWYEWHVLPTEEEVAICCRDVTDLRIQRESLKESEERYSLALQSADLGLWDHDLCRGTTYISPRLREMLDLSPDWQGDPATEWRLWAHPEDRLRVEESLAEACRGRQSRWFGEFRYRRRSGEWLWVEARVVLVRDSRGEVIRAVGSLVDVTERHEVQEQMERMALHDTLTGLPNRVLFLDRLNQSLAVARRRGWYFFAVLFLDLDRFKDINDSLGHSAGDEFLKGVARRISECLRAGDTVARLGGDEFAVLLNDLRDPADAQEVAERIQQHLSRPLRIQGQEFIPAASIGLARSTVDYRSAEEVLRDADTAMYRAKEGGRNRIVAFTREMHQEISRRVQLESDLRHGVDEGQFVIFLQPIVDLAWNRVTGAEALVRWVHPELGTRSPGEFIRVAEETGLILPIGEFVLREACRTAAGWRERFPEAGDLTVSVNFSARQFTHGKPLAIIREALAESGLPPGCLKVEITESLLMEDLGEILRMLQEIDRMGVRLQLDDFGTGYSSLSYLQRFPIRTIKVDRSFVSSIDQTASRELVRAIVTLAQSLKMETIAEGVETQAQLVAVRELGCLYAQGYLFSRPVSVEAFEDLVRRGVGRTGESDELPEKS